MIAIYKCDCLLYVLDFLCSMSSEKIRGCCSFCWYWWNWWPSLFKLSFHNYGFIRLPSPVLKTVNKWTLDLHNMFFDFPAKARYWICNVFFKTFVINYYCSYRMINANQFMWNIILKYNIIFFRLTFNNWIACEYCILIGWSA